MGVCVDLCSVFVLDFELVLFYDVTIVLWVSNLINFMNDI